MQAAVIKDMGTDNTPVLDIAKNKLLLQLAHCSGMAFFEQLVQAVSKTMDTDITLVSQIMDDGETVQSLAVYWDGQKGENFSYSLKGTPCAEAIAKSFCTHSQNVQQLYPVDTFLSDNQIEAYAGFPLYGPDQNIIGLIATMSRKPFTHDDKLYDLIQLIAARARAELQNHITQEQLKAALSAAHLANSSKSMFMANISHELKNPLSAMIGFSKLIRDAELSQKEIADYASEIYSTGEDLLALISDILSIATLEISNGDVENIAFDLNAVARTGHRLMHEQANAKHLEMPAVERIDPILVSGDMRLTKKALLNLLSNAIKYTERGAITVSTELTAGGDAMICVRDTGVGISEGVLTALMKPFADIANIYDVHQDGRGLGIPLSQLLMEKQGAKLTIESKEKEGTLACLIFPKSHVRQSSDDFI